MSSKSATLLVAGLMGLLFVKSACAEPVETTPEKLAARMAEQLMTLCPAARPDDVAAHETCSTGLRDASFIPFAPDGLLFGGDQPNLRLPKKQLTHFKPSVFQLMYLSLFMFTGRWTVETDDRDHVSVIRLEAYFRNALPPGEFPYPFWHSAAKWNDYETATELKFYLNHDGKVFVITRSQRGSDAGRGPFEHRVPPVFDGHWQWTDATGQTQPHVSLFSNLYSVANPYLEPLDKAYRDFAIEARKGSCLDCHAPNNEAGMDHLVLLQTPIHASGEIERVLKEVKNGEMPQDDLGLRKEIDPALRADIIKTGEEFRKALAKADSWEAEQHH